MNTKNNMNIKSFLQSKGLNHQINNDLDIHQTILPNEYYVVDHGTRFGKKLQGIYYSDDKVPENLMGQPVHFKIFLGDEMCP